MVDTIVRDVIWPGAKSPMGYYQERGLNMMDREWDLGDVRFGVDAHHCWMQCRDDSDECQVDVASCWLDGQIGRGLGLLVWNQSFVVGFR